MLKIENLSVRYGVIEAVKGISFSVKQGEIVSLIGSNGAGKTTTLRAISGLEKASSGFISFEGEDLGRMPPNKIVEKGIAHVPEGRRIFSKLSVADNLEMGAVLRKDKEGIKKDFKRVYEIFPRLEERKNQAAGTLSGGEQQMLSVGRAMMTNAKLILLDEPSMGLAPLVVETIFKTIVEINREGKTILLVEQNAFMALKITSRAYVLETGHVVAEGNSETLLADNKIKEAYLGI